MVRGCSQLRTPLPTKLCLGGSRAGQCYRRTVHTRQRQLRPAAVSQLPAPPYLCLLRASPGILRHVHWLRVALCLLVGQRAGTSKPCTYCSGAVLHYSLRSSSSDLPAHSLTPRAAAAEGRRRRRARASPAAAPAPSDQDARRQAGRLRGPELSEAQPDWAAASSQPRVSIGASLR